MEGTTPDRPVGGLSEDPVLRDPALPAPGSVSGAERTPESGSGGPPGSGFARGSLRRRQWTDPPVGDLPGEKAGEDAQPAGAAAGGLRRAITAVTVLVAASALLVGLGGVVAAKVRKTPGRGPETVAAGNPVASDHPVPQGLPTATPVNSGAPGKGHAQPKTNGGRKPAPSGGGPGLLGFWRIGSGSGALGKDETHRFPAAVHDVARGTGHGGCGIFNGRDSQLTTARPVLDTGKGAGFTVSAWVYLTSTSGFATAVSQDGKASSAFYLQYSRADNRWAFTRNARALSSAAPALRTWTHLVGVYRAGGLLALYVNGARQGTAHDTSPAASAGALAIGRGEFHGKRTDYFAGQINDVKIFGRALTVAQIKKL
jgi:Concanavalin A-like lectin/glucanases superfamily